MTKQQRFGKKFYVWEETFAIVKSKKTFPGAFATVVDRNETTVVIDQSKLKSDRGLTISRGWKVITFDLVLPFNLVGFLASVAKKLAEEKIPIFVVSSYSTDHVLVKAKNLSRALEKLHNLDFKV